MSLLELENVIKHYDSSGEQVRAVDGVSLTIAAGEMVAIHGPSGSGKTTLLLLIAALLRPDSGTIRYRGADLATLTERETARYLRREVGFVHQSNQLMPRASALENATVKLLLDGLAPRQARQRAQPWLQRIGLGERMGHTPEELSAGERQRVAIARALVAEPQLVLADEPTANLDSARSLETVALLGEIAREQHASVILVTHDREAAALADRRFELRDGRLREQQSQAGASQPGISGEQAPRGAGASGLRAAGAEAVR